MNPNSNTLAVKGGIPIRKGGWPKWPIYDLDTLKALQAVLEGGRWAISSPYNGKPLHEREFANRFAEFCNVKYCIPTDHGSSALAIALEAVDIGPGDEVIVPAVTWVATATAVTNVNAIPIIVDVEPDTLCIDPKCIENAITGRTAAIIPVHLYNGMAEMDEILSISRKYHIPVIEDCAHVHGARWRDRSVGSWGVVGAFSMQQSKVLTCGEGGAVVTDDPGLAHRLEQLRADSRIYTNNPLDTYDMELVTSGSVQGTNFCLSEFQAALLIDQLNRLKEQNQQRQENGAYLDTIIGQIDGLVPLKKYPQLTHRTYYCYVVHCDRKYFADQPITVLCNALQAELNIPFFPVYEPLHRVSSYRAGSKRRNHLSKDHLLKLDTANVVCPVAEKASDEYICFPHWVLLGNKKDMEDIGEAFLKVQRLAHLSAEQPQYDHEG